MIVPVQSVAARPVRELTPEYVLCNVLKIPLSERLDDERFVRGLNDRRLGDLLDHYLSGRPGTTDGQRIRDEIARLLKSLHEKGETVEFELEGFPAIVMQHECDHLDGVLYVDRIEDTTRFAYEEEAARFLDLAGEDLEGEEE